MARYRSDACAWRVWPASIQPVPFFDACVACIYTTGAFCFQILFQMVLQSSSWRTAVSGSVLPRPSALSGSEETLRAIHLLRTYPPFVRSGTPMTNATSRRRRIREFMNNGREDARLVPRARQPLF